MRFLAIVLTALVAFASIVAPADAAKRVALGVGNSELSAGWFGDPPHLFNETDKARERSLTIPIHYETGPGAARQLEGIKT
jgi:hypothetical protein